MSILNKKTRRTMKMILEIKNCAECPFSNNDNEYGRDCCNLALQLGKDIKLDNWEQLPSDKRHKDCPIIDKIELVAVSYNLPLTVTDMTSLGIKTTKLKIMIKRLLEKLNLIKPQKTKLVISDVMSCSCDNGIIVCPGCNGEKSKFGICAGCKGSGIRTCGKCGGKNKT